MTNGLLDIHGFGHVTHSPTETALLVDGGYLKRVQYSQARKSTIWLVKQKWYPATRRGKFRQS